MAGNKVTKTKLPNQIYVTLRKDDGSTWLEASDDIEGFDRGDVIGIYSLSEKKVKAILHSLG